MCMSGVRKYLRERQRCYNSANEKERDGIKIGKMSRGRPLQESMILLLGIDSGSIASRKIFGIMLGISLNQRNRF